MSLSQKSNRELILVITSEIFVPRIEFIHWHSQLRLSQLHNIQDIQQRLQQLENILRRELMLHIKDLSKTTEVAHISMDTSLGQVIDYLSKVKLVDTEIFTKLMKLDAAHCQLELGLYGLCSDCEMDIEPPRLIADPTEQRCTHCEQRYHREHRHELRLNH
jgi:DnaK suppressor protein